MDFKEQLTAWRHYLHQHPETAFEEKTAPQLAAEQMRAWGIQVEEGIGRTGVVGMAEAVSASGRIWMLWISQNGAAMTIFPCVRGKCMAAVMTAIR